MKNLKTIKTVSGEELVLRLEPCENFVGNLLKINKWKERIDRMMKLNNVPLKISVQGGDTGAWCCHNPERRELGCGLFWYDTENVAPVTSILHEMGHWVDESTNFDNPMEYFVTLGTMELETRAWLVAIDLGLLIGFDEWNHFRELAKYCLGSYFKNSFGVSFQDMMRGFNGKNPTWENAWGRIERKLAYVEELKERELA